MRSASAHNDRSFGPRIKVAEFRVIILLMALFISTGSATEAGECLLLELRLSGSGTDTLLSWEQSSGESYCVERGDVDVLRATDGDFTLAIEQELASHTTTASLIFSGTPGVGEAYWFVVRNNPDGSFDTGCVSQLESRDDEILGAGDICVN